MKLGVPPPSRMTASAMAFSCNGVMPGLMASATASSAAAVSRPATAIFSIWDRDLSVMRRRSKSTYAALLLAMRRSSSAVTSSGGWSPRTEKSTS